MKVVWKYELQFAQKQKITLPKDSKIISVLENKNLNIITMYAEIESEQTEEEVYEVHIAATGKPFKDEGYTFIGTLPLFRGIEIYHFFYKKDDQ